MADTVTKEEAAQRAAACLQRILGDKQYQELVEKKAILLPSKRYPGRVYRLTFSGLSFREPWEESYRHTVCIVAAVPNIPGDDMVTTRVMLIQCDEKSLLTTANVYVDGDEFTHNQAMMRDEGATKAKAALVIWSSTLFFVVLLAICVIVCALWAWQCLVPPASFWGFCKGVFSCCGIVVFALILRELFASAWSDLYWRGMCFWRWLTPKHPRWQGPGRP